MILVRVLTDICSVDFLVLDETRHPYDTRIGLRKMVAALAGLLFAEGIVELGRAVDDLHGQIITLHCVDVVYRCDDQSAVAVIPTGTEETG
jgi:hypothetical protein